MMVAAIRFVMGIRVLFAARFGIDDEVIPAPVNVEALEGTPGLEELLKIKDSTCDDDDDCKCKEVLVTYVCSLKELYMRWSAVLRKIDVNGDGYISEVEWRSLGYSAAHNSGEYLPGGGKLVGASSTGREGTEEHWPRSIDDAVQATVKATSESFEGLIEKVGCGRFEKTVRALSEHGSPETMARLEVFADVCLVASQMSSGEKPKDDVAGDEKNIVVDGLETTRVQQASLLQSEDTSTLTGYEAAFRKFGHRNQELIRGDIDISSITYDTDVREYINMSSFKKIPRALKLWENEVVYAGTANAVGAMLKSEFCHRDTWRRKTTHLRCKPGWYQGGSGIDVGFCYRHCRPGYSRFGDHCYEHCPADYNDVGVTCQREYCDGDCWPWNWRISHWSKHIYHEPGCSITSNRCSHCPDGYYMALGWCYQKCKPGYHCSSDAAATGLVNCESGHSLLNTECGLACAHDTRSCVANTFEMVQGVIEAIVSTATLFCTWGGSAAATPLAKGALQTSAKVTAKNAKKLAIRFTTEKFKKKLKEITMDKIRETIGDELITKLKNKFLYEYGIGYALSNTEGLIEYYINQYKKEESEVDRLNKIVKDVDPFGIANAIDGATGEDTDDPNKQLANWLTVANVVDPTGITGALAGIAKHGFCEKTWNGMRDEMSGSIQTLTPLKLPVG